MGDEGRGAGLVQRDRPDRVTWIVVGDKQQIMPGLEELGFGPVREIDADGNVLNR